MYPLQDTGNGYTYLLRFYGNRLYLTEDALGKLLHCHTAPGRSGDEILRICFIKRSKISHIRQKTGGFYYLLKATSRRFQNRSHIPAALLCLRCNPLRNSTRSRIHWNLTGCIDKPVHLISLRIWPDCSRRLVCYDNLHILFLRLLHYADSGSRTHTPRGHRNLNPARLPIPPYPPIFRHCRTLYYVTICRPKSQSIRRQIPVSEAKAADATYRSKSCVFRSNPALRQNATETASQTPGSSKLHIENIRTDIKKSTV